MELSSSDKERIQHQYDALAKKTLVGEAKSHRRTLAKRAAREVTFSDLSESELAQLFTTDEYESDYFRFQVSGFDVLVKNELLAEALNALPETLDLGRDYVCIQHYASKMLLIAPHSIDGYYWMIYAMFQLDHPEMARGELRMAQRNLLEEEYDELIERLKVAGFSRCYGITPA